MDTSQQCFSPLGQWKVVVNNFTQHSTSTCQEKTQQNRQDQYRNYLTTHHKDHFQEYLIGKGLNHQLRSLRNQVDTSDLQFCLSMFTDLDVLDEDNKFVCKMCTTQKQCESLQSICIATTSLLTTCNTTILTS